MSDPHDDHDLRRAFRELRDDTLAPDRVPEFQAMLERARRETDAPALELVPGSPPMEHRRRRVLWRTGWATAALAAAVAGVLLTTGGDEGDDAFDALVASYSADPSSGAWRSPTSGLMDVPGMELVRTIPTIGGTLRGAELGRRPDAPGSEGADL